MKQIGLTLLAILTFLTTFGQEKSEQYFQEVVDEISQMLEEQKPIDFKRAVFLVENAYMNGTLDWDYFNKEIGSKIPVFEKMIAQTGFGKYKTGKNWAIHTYMTDTTVFDNGNQRYHYDYVNYTNDTTGLVYNLLKTNLGNCRSLPYLYKIWCNEFGATAYLSTAPMHVYVRQQDENGVWWNIELTSKYKYVPSEDYVVQLQITEEARKSGLYMKALSEKENLALCLDDLLRYYMQRNDVTCDEFTEKLVLKINDYMPISETRLEQFSCLKERLDLAMNKMGISNYQDIGNYPNLVQHYKAMDEVGRFIESIGYKPISEELYQNLTEQTKKKAENQKQ